MKVNKYIDHTLLKQDATYDQIEKLCLEALNNEFMSVCVNPCFVQKCAGYLKQTSVLVCTVIGFPLGANTTETKVFETKDAISKGAQEIDMVINVSTAKEHDYLKIEDEIKAIKDACGNITLKVILETCLLTNEEIVECCLAAKRAGADFVKTSTGFSTGGATVEHIKLMRNTVGKEMGVKASGGVRSASDAKNMIEAGASRIGTSSGVVIVKDFDNANFEANTSNSKEMY